MTTIANLKGRDIKREEIQTWKESSLYSSQTRANSMAHALTTEKPNQMNGTGGITQMHVSTVCVTTKEIGVSCADFNPRSPFSCPLFHDVSRRACGADGRLSKPPWFQVPQQACLPPVVWQAFEV